MAVFLPEGGYYPLHDCSISAIRETEDGVLLEFGYGFNVTKENPLNNTGLAAVLLVQGEYIDGAYNRECFFQGANDNEPVPMREVPIDRKEAYRLLPEVLDFTWEPEQKLFIVDGCDGSAYCRLVFFCKDVWFCWNNLPEDAWFQDWP